MNQICAHSQREAKLHPITRQLAPNSPSDLIERFLPTGTIPIWLVEDIPSDEQVAAALDTIRAIRPDLTTALLKHWDGLDTHYEHEGLDRLAIAITRLAQGLHVTPMHQEGSRQ